MNIGLLWFDNDPKRNLAVKLSRGILYYIRKYGQNPNTCTLHPTMLDGSETEISKIQIVQSSAMLPNHFWIEERKKEE